MVHKDFYLMTCGGGLVVSIPDVYSNDPSLNPAGNLNKQTDKNKQKRDRGSPIFKKRLDPSQE